MSDTFEVPERESMEFDVVIVGAGPAGLSAAIRLKQLNPDLTVVVLDNVCRWLGEKAEELGVEIYPGFAGSEILYDDAGAAVGVATGDMGVGRDGKPGPNYARGMALLGKYVLIAFVRLAAGLEDRRRVIPLPPGRQSGRCRFCSASQL